MNAQEMFETVARHLFAQGKRAGVENEEGDFSCLYRAPDGTKCAIGCLLTDEQYAAVFLNPDDPMNESQFQNQIGTGVTGLNRRLADKRLPIIWPSDWPGEFSIEGGLSRLNDLQDIHDQAHTWQSSHKMRQALIEWGARCNLSTDFLSTLSFKAR